MKDNTIGNYEYSENQQQAGDIYFDVMVKQRKIPCLVGLTQSVITRNIGFDLLPVVSMMIHMERLKLEG